MVESQASVSSKKRGTLKNGFPTIPGPEKEYMLCKADNISPYTLPLEALYFEPGPDVVTASFKNKDKERKIYLNRELLSEELQDLKKLQLEVKKQRLELLPSITVMAGRFLSRSRGDSAKAIKLMRSTQSWRSEYFKAGPVTDDEIMEDLKHGICYFSGRDKCLRPTLILRGNRIPQQWYKEKRIDKLIRILVFCMEFMLRYMLVPGKVENNCIIVDLKGLSAYQVPIGALSDIYNVMSHHYIGRVFKFYICNLSTSLSTISGIVKALLTDRQKQKLFFVDNVRELRKDFALHQLEVDLGGTREVLKEFFPFPLQAGPFEAGCATGPDASAPSGVHTLLTPAGALGRIWDPKRSVQENAALEFTPEASEFFRKNNLPPHPHLEAAETSTADTRDGQQEDEADEEDVNDDIVMVAGEVKPSGMFNCMCCR